MNIVLRRSLGTDRAVSLTGSSSGQKRELFFVPWRGVTMVGTHYEPLQSSEPGEAPQAVIERFVRQIADLAPRAGITLADVARVHWGALPLERVTDSLPSRTAALASGAAETGAQGLVLMAAEKLTSAPQLSVRVLERIGRELPGSLSRVPADAHPDQPSLAIGAQDLAPAALARLRSRYGTVWPAVARHASSRPELLLPVSSSSAVLGVEVVHAIREEMALGIDDLLHRRLGLADVGEPDAAVVAAVAALAGSEWRQQTPGDVPGSRARDALPG